MAELNNFFNNIRKGLFQSQKQLSGIVFIDVEVGLQDKRSHDFGAVKDSGKEIHTASRQDFSRFIADSRFVCGHNIIQHDLKYLSDIKCIADKKPIDSLFLSPLLFPKRPYHKLLKDDKLQTEEMNNPLNDCLKARDLFYDEVNAFRALSPELQNIYFGLLHQVNEFSAFFEYLQFQSTNVSIDSLISSTFEGKICQHSPINLMVKEHPIELAYALALVSTGDYYSITPPWLLHHFPNIENVLQLLCSTPCHDSHCTHCENKLNIYKGLKDVFGFESFRTYDGEPLQEKSVQAAINGKSLLAIFPTGGGKSLTFQLPAILSGRAVHGLTVVISPLQSLMKDQVDKLAEQGITEAVTINGLLDPVSRANAFDRVANGSATLLYIAPEMLRSKTIEKLLMSRNVVRFVIDEAHCFSSWGQDFRVDYLYIGDFIRKLQEKKKLPHPIPISCFTATAKQKVITDICDYFKRKLDLDLKIFASSSTRKNLHYSVIYAETEEAKYNTLRSLMMGNPCPTIIYVSRTRKTKELALKLSSDGIDALPFNGKMDANDKIANQNAFISNRVQAMVATSAFGMGVDKKDVGMVIHYDISDSLENYVQEAGRAGRDPKTAAKCYVLYNDHDLDKHFILLNQTKISISEIQQVWSAIKTFTKSRKQISCSALEIARQAGWNDDVSDIENRVRTAISALEEAGYVSRGNNVPHVFATGIMVKNMEEAHRRINSSRLFLDDQEKQNAIRIIKSLISSKSRSIALDDDAESRVDYLADRLGMTKETVISTVNQMRQDGILADTNDMSAYIEHSENKAKLLFEQFAKLELFFLNTLAKDKTDFFLKELNERANEANIASSIKYIKTLLYYLAVKSYIKKKENAYNGMAHAVLCQDVEMTLRKCQRRHNICRFIIGQLYATALAEPLSADNKGSMVQFSVVTLLKKLNANQSSDLFQTQEKCQLEEIEDALLYLSTIGALRLEGGFMVIYNAMEVHRLKEMKYRYKLEDYSMLDEFYKQKRHQIHIVGEYANMMVRDYDAALQYVQDYFQMDYKKFISKYFKGERLGEIERNITPDKYRKLFGTLSEKQRSIIDDKQSKYIVVAAGPGSGKTRVLVHKLASLLLMEDVKHEQLLMLTFSRAAATEFKQRLMELIGNAANFVEIKTFHAFSFDLLGKIGNLDEAEDVVRRAAEMIEKGEAEQGRINKTVLVIDEAQDMDKDEFALVRALINNNEEMRVIAVGDDDQNIYQFRGSDSRYMQAFIDEMQATKYEMTENYRSARNIVTFANQFAQRIRHRMKSLPGVAVTQESGMVQITQYESEHLEIPLVQSILATYNNERACVLTYRNEEAARIVGLLTKHGIRAKLIQSTEGFRFSNMAEVRYFLKCVNQHPDTPVISDDTWEKAKQQTLTKYETSTCINYLKVFFQKFENINHTKYRSDLMEFVCESNLEDFCEEDRQTIMVSTIHKSKGREFDTVYMLLAGEQMDTDEQFRKLYVGMTRAKQRLFIHCNTTTFASLSNKNIDYKEDINSYPLPEEITVPLTMRDVFLDYFKDKKRQILQLRSGQTLYFDNGCLRLPSGESVSIISNKMRNELQHWFEKGYFVQSAKINFIVAWKGKEESEETAVLLPELMLKKL
ncbi:MAG: RecQ family ATP-dependent DNA helicase [Bacteroidales bacterium]|nr:RecQ family ATP-dependent DNA helicase [Bacteroidales bacterium]